MPNLSTKVNKKLSEWEWQDFWMLAVKKYRISKKIRQLAHNGNKYDFNSLAKKLDIDRHYIYQAMVMNIKPSDEFITKLERLNNDK